MRMRLRVKIQGEKAKGINTPFTFLLFIVQLSVFNLSFSLLDSQFTTIVTAARAYGVVDVKCAAVRACSQCRGFHYVMGTTFGLAGV
jgi:hypothetical protein